MKANQLMTQREKQQQDTSQICADVQVPAGNFAPTPAHRTTLQQHLCKELHIGDVLAEAVIKLCESRGAYASLAKLHVVQQVVGLLLNPKPQPNPVAPRLYVLTLKLTLAFTRIPFQVVTFDIDAAAAASAAIVLRNPKSYRAK